jgi:hypothetical protein
MKTWITNSWIYRTFGQTGQTKHSEHKSWHKGVWELTDYTPNYSNLTKALEDVTAHCNREQMTVKVILPLTSARTYEYGAAVEYTHWQGGVGAAAGIGYGWGFSNVIGFAALLERVEQISDEEYERRLKNMESPSIAASMTSPPLPASA